MSQYPNRFRASPTHRVGGRITVPGDKSISHRALMLGAIAEGTSLVRGFLASEDCLATQAALEAMGVAIDRQENGFVRIEGVGPRGLKTPSRTLGTQAKQITKKAGPSAGSAKE